MEYCELFGLSHVEKFLLLPTLVVCGTTENPRYVPFRRPRQTRCLRSEVRCFRDVLEDLILRVLDTGGVRPR